MNEDFFTPEQREIRRLKLTIEAFKKYDEKRKQYVNRLQDELEEYSEMYLEMKKIVEERYPADGQRFAKYMEKIKCQRQTLVELSAKLARIKMADKIAAEKIVNDDNIRKVNVQLKEENRSLKENNSRLIKMDRENRKTISNLITEIESLKRKLAQ